MTSGRRRDSGAFLLFCVLGRDPGHTPWAGAAPIPAHVLLQVSAGDRKGQGEGDSDRAAVRPISAKMGCRGGGLRGDWHSSEPGAAGVWARSVGPGGVWAADRTKVLRGGGLAPREGARQEGLRTQPWARAARETWEGRVSREGRGCREARSLRQLSEDLAGTVPMCKAWEPGGVLEEKRGPRPAGPSAGQRSRDRRGHHWSQRPGLFLPPASC